MHGVASDDEHLDLRSRVLCGYDGNANPCGSASSHPLRKIAYHIADSDGACGIWVKSEY
jgi:hypothetical protein